MEQKRWATLVFLITTALLFLSQEVHLVTAQQNDFTCDDVSEISQPECNALVALYLNTSGPDWTRNDDWLVTPTPCGWFGITCEMGHIVRIYLLDYNLNGSIPPEIGNLFKLRHLELSRNQLNGNIPSEIGNLTELQELRLDQNELSGHIPPELGNLVNLKGLYIHSNQLSGSIPSEIGQLTNLTDLFLWGNQLNGYIPPELGNLSKLESLDLFTNQLSGIIPPELGYIPTLRGIYLSNNQLSGNIPAELGNLPNVRELVLSNNPLSGTLPKELINLDLDDFRFDNTALCEPDNTAFTVWMNDIGRLKKSGLVCESPLELPQTGNSSNNLSVFLVLSGIIFVIIGIQMRQSNKQSQISS